MTGLRYTTCASPVGELLLLGDGDALRGLYLQDGRKRTAIGAEWKRDPRAFDEAAGRLREFFAGERTQFDLALEPGGTAFQLTVWDALQAIEYGTTLSYTELARRIGRPTAVRAVGAANGANPIAIVIPCHRLIGAGGSLTGYGGGLERKRLLLELEAAQRGA